MIIPRPIRHVGRTMLLKPSYALASTAAQLAARGLTPRQVEAAHPRTAIKGAGWIGKRISSAGHVISPIPGGGAKLAVRAAANSVLRRNILAAHAGGANPGSRGAASGHR